MEGQGPPLVRMAPIDSSPLTYRGIDMNGVDTQDRSGRESSPLRGYLPSGKSILQGCQIAFHRGVVGSSYMEIVSHLGLHPAQDVFSSTPSVSSSMMLVPVHIFN